MAEEALFLDEEHDLPGITAFNTVALQQKVEELERRLRDAGLEADTALLKLKKEYEKQLTEMRRDLRDLEQEVAHLEGYIDNVEAMNGAEGAKAHEAEERWILLTHMLQFIFKTCFIKVESKEAQEIYIKIKQWLHCPPLPVWHEYDAVKQPSTALLRRYFFGDEEGQKPESMYDALQGLVEDD